MSSTVARPASLWIAVIMNVLVGLLSVGMLIVLLAVDVVAQAIELPLELALAAGALAVAMISASVAALAGIPRSGPWMLATALGFYGVIAAQNLLLLASLDIATDPGMAKNLFTHAGRACIEIAINVWAISSTRTVAFFRQTSVNWPSR